MCSNCFPEWVRTAVYAAGKEAGAKYDCQPPLPTGAVLRADWDRGVADGLEIAANDAPSRSPTTLVNKDRRRKK